MTNSPVVQPTLAELLADQIGDNARSAAVAVAQLTQQNNALREALRNAYNESEALHEVNDTQGQRIAALEAELAATEHEVESLHQQLNPDEHQDDESAVQVHNVEDVVIENNVFVEPDDSDD